KPGHGQTQPDPLVFTPASAAHKSGRLAGTAVAYGPLMDDEVYRATIAAEFNYVTAENAMKWGELQPTADPKVWDFEEADAIAEFADEHGMKLKGHALVWHSQAPSFINDSMTRSKLAMYMTRHIHKTTKHFRKDAHSWDVV